MAGDGGEDRGPLLIISSETDNTLPWAIANASYKKERRNESVTEIVEMPNRGHALVIDSGVRSLIPPSPSCSASSNNHSTPPR